MSTEQFGEAAVLSEHSQERDVKRSRPFARLSAKNRRASAPVPSSLVDQRVDMQGFDLSLAAARMATAI
jgi:hypothetical protein